MKHFKQNIDTIKVDPVKNVILKESNNVLLFNKSTLLTNQSLNTQVLDSLEQARKDRFDRIERWKKYQEYKKVQDSIKRHSYNIDTIPYFLKESKPELTISLNNIADQLNIDRYSLVSEVRNSKARKSVFIGETIDVSNSSKMIVSKDMVSDERNSFDFSVLLMLAAVLLLAVIRFNWKSSFARLFYAQFNYREFLKLFNENNLLVRRMNTMLDVLVVIVFSVFAKEMYNILVPESTLSGVDFYLYSVLGIVGFLLFSKVVKMAVGKLSLQKVIFNLHDSSFNLSLRILSVIFLPIAIGISFSSERYFLAFVYLSFILLITTFIYNSFRLLKIFHDKGVSSLFWILYLCALEILPIVIIVLLVVRK